jgi:hypothetical protein
MVAKMTGHKDTRSLNHYDPGLSELQKLDMGVTIALQGPLMRGENIDLPGNELKRRAAIGPSLGRVFYSCIQKGSRQCSFFKFKQDGLAQVNFVNNWITFYGFFLYR